MGRALVAKGVFVGLSEEVPPDREDQTVKFPVAIFDKIAFVSSEWPEMNEAEFAKRWPIDTLRTFNTEQCKGCTPGKNYELCWPEDGSCVVVGPEL